MSVGRGMVYNFVVHTFILFLRFLLLLRPFLFILLLRLLVLFTIKLFTPLLLVN
jgi:hypothetical protein